MNIHPAAFNDATAGSVFSVSGKVPEKFRFKPDSLANIPLAQVKRLLRRPNPSEFPHHAQHYRVCTNCLPALLQTSPRRLKVEFDRIPGNPFALFTVKKRCNRVVQARGRLIQSSHPDIFTAAILAGTSRQTVVRMNTNGHRTHRQISGGVVRS